MRPRVADRGRIRPSVVLAESISGKTTRQRRRQPIPRDLRHRGRATRTARSPRRRSTGPGPSGLGGRCHRRRHRRTWRSRAHQRPRGPPRSRQPRLRGADRRRSCGHGTFVLPPASSEQGAVSWVVAAAKGVADDLERWAEQEPNALASTYDQRPTNPTQFPSRQEQLEGKTYSSGTSLSTRGSRWRTQRPGRTRAARLSVGASR